MDAEMILERMRVLAEQENFAGIGAICESSTVKTIAKVAQMSAWGLTKGIGQLLKEVKPRDFSEVPVTETEIEPATASTLITAGIVTLGDVKRTPDDRLLKIIGNYMAMIAVRAVEKKYLTTADKQGGNSKRGRRDS